MILTMALAIGMHAQVAWGTTNPSPLTAAAVPTRCEEHQHVVHHPAYVSGECAANVENNSMYADMMVYHPALPDKCVDDMHEVTEKEWLAIQTRLKDLEATTMRLPAGPGIVLDGANPTPSENMEFGAKTTPGPGLHFPPDPKEGQLWDDGAGDFFIYTHGSWGLRNLSGKEIEHNWKPTSTGMNACPQDQHIHSKGARFTTPDVKNAPVPKGDNLCHRDLDDSTVYPHGSKKLEAAK